MKKLLLLLLIFFISIVKVKAKSYIFITGEGNENYIDENIRDNIISFNTKGNYIIENINEENNKIYNNILVTDKSDLRNGVNYILKSIEVSLPNWYIVEEVCYINNDDYIIYGKVRADTSDSLDNMDTCYAFIRLYHLHSFKWEIVLEEYSFCSEICYDNEYIYATFTVAKGNNNEIYVNKYGYNGELIDQLMLLGSKTDESKNTFIYNNYLYVFVTSYSKDGDYKDFKKNSTYKSINIFKVFCTDMMIEDKKMVGLNGQNDYYKAYFFEGTFTLLLYCVNNLMFECHDSNVILLRINAELDIFNYTNISAFSRFLNFVVTPYDIFLLYSDRIDNQSYVYIRKYSLDLEYISCTEYQLNSEMIFYGDMYYNLNKLIIYLGTSSAFKYILTYYDNIVSLYECNYFGIMVDVFYNGRCNIALYEENNFTILNHYFCKLYQNSDENEKYKCSKDIVEINYNPLVKETIDNNIDYDVFGMYEEINKYECSNLKIIIKNDFYIKDMINIKEEVYNTGCVISFCGKGYLNGELITSPFKIEKEGTYKLIVEGKNLYKTINFSIENQCLNYINENIPNIIFSPTNIKKNTYIQNYKISYEEIKSEPSYLDTICMIIIICSITSVACFINKEKIKWFKH